MPRTPEEVKNTVCNLVRHLRQERPSDLETMVACINAVPKYTGRATAILNSLRTHRRRVPSLVVRGTRIVRITEEIATRGAHACISKNR